MHTTSDANVILGVDIGGANLKFVDSLGHSLSVAFPMWLRAPELGLVLKQSLTQFPQVGELAVTMTGELADCFATRREGVSAILDEVAKAFPPQQTWVYAIGDHWLSPEQARRQPWEVAASNWYALGGWLGRAHQDARWADGFVRDVTKVPSAGWDLVVDIGSTTVDITPLQHTLAHGRVPATLARTDRERMQLGQLVYTGMQRTAVAAIVRELNVDGVSCPVMAERFATSDDCYLILGATPPAPDDCDSADGRARTVSCAMSRIARMVGEDGETLTEEILRNLADQVVDAQARQVAQAVNRNLPRAAPSCSVVFVGHGREMARRVLEKLRGGLDASNQVACLKTVWLDELLSPELSRSAPALAVAELRRWHLGMRPSAARVAASHRAANNG